MSTLQPDFQQDPEQEGNARVGGKGNGNHLRDYRLQQLEKDVGTLTEKVDLLTKEIANLPLALLKWLVPTFIAAIAAFVGIVALVL